jgi:stage V sporulation protein R
MTSDINDLQHWDEIIQKWVHHYGLNCYPQEFQVCDHHEMIGYMSYSGMPSHYSHWSYGKGFERQKMMYDFGVSGLPYEMVINSNPCVAYLMRDNTLLLQILTIAHVYGHNDFFANNFTFTSSMNAARTLEVFRTNAKRVDEYIEDPSIGIDEVESIIDHAHSLSFQCSKNLAIKKLSLEEQRKRANLRDQPKEDPFQEIHKREEPKIPTYDKIPLEADEDILEFIAHHNPYLPAWKKDLISIVDTQARYFIPQMETKIMNEGWASYWHHKILNSLNLPQDLYMEFLVRHNQVLRPHPGGLNPYHMGFVIWQDIEKRWNEGTLSDDDMAELNPDVPSVNKPGREKMFEVRKSDRDTSFLRRFLTVDLMRELDLFQHEKRGDDRVVTKVADDESWMDIKDNLIKSVGTGSLPVIKIEDADFGKNRTLYLKHYFEGRELQLDYAEATLKHVKALWEREVVLETELGGRKVILKFDGDELKTEKLQK